MLKKDITFIYYDSIQRQVFEMIAEQAKKRGYKTQITDDKFVKCEIGWYCEHINHPQYSKFSIIMLHDIVQQFGNWPDIWMREPWDKYDIGFLPNKVWVENWNKCSRYYYANPRSGVYLTGWPKADRIADYNNKKKLELIKKYGINASKKTVLYAPAWENDHKQEEFVQAALVHDVNIIVKQFPCTENTYPEQYRCIMEMYELHKNNPRVIIADPKDNILDVITVSDILVSEESSTMTESVMMGKPAISVSNWLIPDTKPSRLPANNYDYVIKTTKEQLSECIGEVISKYSQYQKQAQDYSNTHFSNIGKCIPMMLDILDAIVEERECPLVALEPQKRIPLSTEQFVQHKRITIKRELVDNYCQRKPIVKQLYHAYQKIKG